MTTSELGEEVYSIVEARIRSIPSPVEYEIAYQARIAAEKIRFAITLIERVCDHTTETEEAQMQLLGALDRLDSVDRKVQERTCACKKDSPNGCRSVHGLEKSGRL
ncbi:MAG TPA: hypothetical protein VHZ07_03635 [Bryobacteraceae bacterium]|nr:hypothetical protein [Bryobacteraceae bacterium]